MGAHMLLQGIFESPLIFGQRPHTLQASDVNSLILKQILRLRLFVEVDDGRRFESGARFQSRFKFYVTAGGFVVAKVVSVRRRRCVDHKSQAEEERVGSNK